jgi:hypothetical protein
MLEWLKDIGYEKHLYDGEDSEKLAAAAGPMCWTFATGWPALRRQSTTRRV